MAEATITRRIPAPEESGIGYVTVASGVDIAAGNNDADFKFSPYTGFSIRTGTLTSMTVTIFASIDGTNYIDITNDLFAVAALASSKWYDSGATRIHARFLRVRFARTAATNAVAFEVLLTKDRK